LAVNVFIVLKVNPTILFPGVNSAILLDLQLYLYSHQHEGGNHDNFPFRGNYPSDQPEY